MTRGVGPLAEMGLRAFLGSGFYYHTRGTVFANEGSLGAKCGELKAFYRVRSARQLAPSFSALSARSSLPTPSAPTRKAPHTTRVSRLFRAIMPIFSSYPFFPFFFFFLFSRLSESHVDLPIFLCALPLFFPSFYKYLSFAHGFLPSFETFC